MSIFDQISALNRPKNLRLFTIELTDTQRKWKTTNCAELWRFVAAFKPKEQNTPVSQGFVLRSIPWFGPEIPTVQKDYSDKTLTEAYQELYESIDKSFVMPKLYN